MNVTRDTTTIKPEDFYSQESEKVKLNWFCYEYALELQMYFNKKVKNKLQKKHIDDHRIVSFCVHYAKSLKTVILKKLSGKSEMILSYHEIENFFPEIGDKLVNDILTIASKAWKSLLDVCVTCPNRCISEQDQKAPMFDDEANFQLDDDEKRIAEALGAREVPEVDEENVLKYRKYLLTRLDKGTLLTGREDFPWEEKYVIGPGSRAEYERLKKTNPSYKDKYKLIDISEEEIEENDLIALVERLSDKKRFRIGLSWLTTENKKIRDFQLLDDFATWVVNW